MPPQAEGMKSLFSESAPSSVPPAATFSALDASSLTTIDTSPVATSLRRAPSSTPTSSSTTMVNVRICEDDVEHGRPQNWIPENIMNASDIRPTLMKVMPRPRSPAGTFE